MPADVHRSASPGMLLQQHYTCFPAAIRSVRSDVRLALMLVCLQSVTCVPSPRCCMAP